MSPRLNPSARRQLVSLSMIACAAAASHGCAHYYFPAVRLDTPEASGVERVGRIDAGLQGGSNLNDPPGYVYPDPDTGGSPEPYLQPSMVNPFLGFTKALGDEWDVGVRLQAAAPLNFRAKYQLSGLPESRAGAGNFSTALGASFGFLMAANGVSYTSGDFAFLAGYRAWRRHLFSLSPWYAFGGASGIAQFASGSQFGGSFGYQYTLEGLFSRFEASWVSGTAGANNLGTLFFGAAIGLNL